jgi:ABC-type glycerol-3-phosphate transport system substrate-binding protein
MVRVLYYNKAKERPCMEDNAGKVRNYILDSLENGELKEGEKLPGARVLASLLKAPFVKVQQALDQLTREGILETEPRKGTYVQAEWRDRILQSNFTAFKPAEGLPWLPLLGKIFAERLPHLRIRNQFKRSVFELRTTVTVQSESRDYLDLAPIFDKCHPDKSVFFSHPFKTFYINGKLPGIPFIFSPRVMFYNGSMFERAGQPPPKAGWTWDDFLSSVRALRRTFPPEAVFGWGSTISAWINFVFRAGGALMDPDAEDMVKIDHPKTQRGLELYAALKKELGYSPGKTPEHTERFCRGGLALLPGPREIMPFVRRSNPDGWGTVPLPLIDGGREISAQATDLICVRKSCTDAGAAAEFVKVMLSEEVQDFIGAEAYGIPIRKLSAFKSINIEDTRDALFLTEASKTSAQYNIDSPELCAMISDGISGMLDNDEDIKTATGKLADAVRTFLRIKKYSETHNI